MTPSDVKEVTYQAVCLLDGHQPYDTFIRFQIKNMCYNKITQLNLHIQHQSLFKYSENLSMC